jgi:cysteine desulfurase
VQPIYLDNNATTRVAPEVLEAMLPFFTEQFGNPSSIHEFGDRAGGAVAAARRSLQALLGADHDHEIVFTSGGSESDTTAIRAGLAAKPDRNEVVTSTVEHPAVLALCDWLERHEGVKVRRVPVDRHGRLEIDAYREALSPRTALVSLMWANNETGTMFPIEGLAELAKQAGALFHTDAVQAVGKVAIELAGTAIDLLSLSGHKLHGPKGVGALYIRRGTRFRALIRGGQQERRRRAGTENVPGIVGLGRAAELVRADLVEAGPRIRSLRDRLERGLLERIADAVVMGDPLDRLPNTTNIAFASVESEAIVLMLSRQGIAASTGSACASGSLEPSHVMQAMGVPPNMLHGAVRLSLSHETTADEIDRVLEVTPPIVDRLREMSPFWPAPAEHQPVPAMGGSA